MLYNFVLIVFTAAFIFRTVKTLFFHIFLWQLKEFRPDRIIAHLKTDYGKKLLVNPLNIIKWILFIVIYSISLININLVEVPFSFHIIIYSFYLFWFIWLIETISIPFAVLRLRFKYPVPTVKSFSVLVFSSVLLLFPFISNPLEGMLLLGPLFDRLLPLFVFIAVVLVNIPAQIYKGLIVFLAARKINNFTGVSKIAITGSYGKTSTKEFLAALLMSKYKTLKTPGSFNTDYSVAAFINSKLTPADDFLIVEMGAYTRGEIKRLCRIVKPEAGIITGIGSQHLELFGSVSNLISAKAELITALPQNGIIVINVNNVHSGKIEKIAKERGLRLITADIKRDVRDVKIGKNYLSFSLKLNKKILPLKFNLAGKNNLENLLLAIKTAYAFGMSEYEIKKASRNIRPPLKTMNVIKQTSDITLIDDTFNVNYEGIISSAAYMKLYKGLRVLVLNPIIELGEMAQNLHFKIGKELGHVCDYLLVTNRNYFNNLSEGLKKGNRKNTVILAADKLSISQVRRKLFSDSVVIFSGKESAKWIKYFS
ncbi:hypothetical protein A3D05_05020 [Candidatus Gottesmanbacteria bacterium RIFCSPHIGHO2_02_FULL_40_24]|nr:MAG: hypothetical protein A3D05_05020 [Candidatus Gottesmanbacteria bacterium RIFCSPHIGHO2_02_FULL_40_24]